MDKNLQIAKLLRKASRLTEAIWKEPKSNMYKHNMNLLLDAYSKVEVLRKAG